MIHSGELRYILTSAGGPGHTLTDDEVDEIIKEVGTDANGNFSYEDLIQTFVEQ